MTRGSDAIAGEIDRGTMEVLLAQPIRRSTIIVTHAVVTTVERQSPISSWEPARIAWSISS
ncbi:MAG: ABC transporter permease subunit [Planctomycetota bacterium]